MAGWVKPQAAALTEKAAIECADYLLSWLRKRNANEFESVLDNMRVVDAKNMREELIYILQHGGKPDNWVD